MDQAEGVGERRVRKRRSVAEKRRIVGLAFQPGASVALVARANDVNANQVFAWRRALQRGELTEPTVASGGLSPVTVCDLRKTAPASGVERAPSSGLIHVEFPGHTLLSIESGADPTLLRVLLENMRK